MSLTLVTGKGGVGKSRISIFLAELRPKSLVTESHAGLLEELENLNKKSMQPRYHAVTRQDLAEAFVSKTVRWAAVAHFIGQSKLFQNLLRLAPNLHELLLLHSWCQMSKQEDLIVDAPSTGHFLALFESVQTARELFDGGSLRKMAEEIHKDFQERSDIQVLAVGIPEHSALEEMKSIKKNLSKIYPKLAIDFILNRKHSKPRSQLNLSPNLEELAWKRPEMEEKRIEGLNFKWILSEGGISFAS